MCGDGNQALEDAQDAISLNPQSAKALVCAAKAYRLLGHHDAARSHLEQAMAIDPHCEEVLVALQDTK